MRKLNALAAGVGFVACILLANFVTSHYGLIPVGFGLMATAGTYFAGLTFVLRDSVQDASGTRGVLLLIVAGAFLSYFISDPFIALASGVAFFVSELGDLAIYTPLRRRGYVRAAVASNVVGAIVDTYLFLWVAGFPIAVQVVAGQLLAKVTVTIVLVLLVLAVRKSSTSRIPVVAP